MRVLILERILSNKRKVFYLNEEVDTFRSKLKVLTSSKHDNTCCFDYELVDDKILFKSIREHFSFNTATNFSITSEFQKQNESWSLLYKVSLDYYLLRYITYCLTPFLLLSYIFSHYSYIYFLIPVGYYLFSDVYLSLRNRYLINKISNKFQRCLSYVEANSI
jgi:hypothetical protein